MRTFILATAVAIPFVATAEGTHQPYAGFEIRDIASLSQQDIQALREGSGWGLALPAELNGFPGPAHVLELSDELGLSDILDGLRLCEDLPANRALVGIEPGCMEWGTEPTGPVAAAIPQAADTISAAPIGLTCTAPDGQSTYANPARAITAPLA